MGTLAGRQQQGKVDAVTNDVATRIAELFGRWPALSGFSLQQPGTLTKDRMSGGLDGALCLADVATDRWQGLSEAQALCDDIGLPTGIKTSGSTGLHVLIPLARQCTYEQSRTLGGLLARVIAARLPDISTVTRQVQKRGGKVYVDYVQNGHGRLLVAPFSVRPLPGAPVSTPISWDEVMPSLDIRSFTIKSVPDRMRNLPSDPLLPVLSETPDLVEALAKLQSQLDE